jgi:uncharacterized lipoprotein NlpE involved in copper resistance
MKKLIIILFVLFLIGCEDEQQQANFINNNEVNNTDNEMSYLVTPIWTQTPEIIAKKAELKKQGVKRYRIYKDGTVVTADVNTRRGLNK